MELAEVEQVAPPTTIRQCVQAQVAALAPEQARVLSAAAVLGTRFDVTLLARVLAIDGLERILAALVEQGLLTPGRSSASRAGGGDALQFTQEIAREVIYESVRKEDRRRGHAAIAQAIAEVASPETLEHTRGPRVQSARSHDYSRPR